jgi:hypothetical protein
MNPILLFTLATIVNVSVSTIRSICTIKCGKWLSALTNAICYGFYPLIVMLTAKDTVDIITNMCITAVANFICVWIIKYVEEKARKDKLWRIDLTIPAEETDFIHRKLANIPHNYIECGPKTVFNCYCATQKESAEVKTLAVVVGGKYSAFESVKM